uniref:SecY-type transporter protein n=1 Tax=Gloeochaete wittrockiana TaxID=38269 RepID=A0A3G1IVZ7_9EUKA|nr:SecY-type transporter protein [Gloeochaete wittrockiana]ASQ40228.1 SecY-type transporter protein [Gloeochaete wittrockiana]
MINKKTGNGTLKSIKNILTNKNVRKRIYITTFVFVIVRFGSLWQIPGVEFNILALKEDMQKDFALVLLYGSSNSLIPNINVFSLQYSAYLTANYMFNAVVNIIPSFKRTFREWSPKQNKELSHRFITIITAFVALIQATLVTVFYIKPYAINWNSDLAFRTITLMTCGAISFAYFDKLLKDKGLGFGLNLFILFSCLPRVPYAIIIDLINDKLNSFSISTITIFFFNSIFLIIGLYLLTLAIIFLNQIKRKIIYDSYAVDQVLIENKNNVESQNTVNTDEIKKIFFTLNINNASTSVLIGLLFIQVLSQTPIIGILVNNYFINKILIILIITGLNTQIGRLLTIDADEMAQTLLKTQAFVERLEPGKNTVNFINNLTTRLNLIGGFFVSFIVVIYKICEDIANSSIFVGTTSMIIIILILLEILKKIQYSLYIYKYKNKYNFNFKKD